MGISSLANIRSLAAYERDSSDEAPKKKKHHVCGAIYGNHPRLTSFPQGRARLRFVPMRIKPLAYALCSMTDEAPKERKKDTRMSVLRKGDENLSSIEPSRVCKGICPILQGLDARRWGRDSNPIRAFERERMVHDSKRIWRSKQSREWVRFPSTRSPKKEKT